MARAVPRSRREIGGKVGEKPSRESLREVKREAKERQRAEAARQKAAEQYWLAETGQARRSRRVGPWIALIASALALAVGAGVLLLQRPAQQTASPGGSTTLPTTASPAASSEEPAPARSVFAGTPAQGWSSGTAAIRIPEVTSTKAYIPEHAAAMRAYVKKYLVAVLLDRRVVLGGDMGPVLRAMGPDQATRWTEWLSKRSDPATGNALGWDALANRFHPGDWSQVEAARVKGRTRVSYSSDNCVVFTWSYAVAYGFAPSTGGPARPVVVRRDGTITACSDLFTKGPGTVLVSSGGYTSLDSVCGADWPYVGFINAWPDPSRAVVTSPSPVETAWDPTEVDSASPNTCFTDTSGFHRP